MEAGPSWGWTALSQPRPDPGLSAHFTVGCPGEPLLLSMSPKKAPPGPSLEPGPC